MYIPDPVSAPLCGECLDRFCDDQRPPWQPDAIARTAGLIRMTFRPIMPAPAAELPYETAELIASFLEFNYLP